MSEGTQDEDCKSSSLAELWLSMHARRVLQVNGVLHSFSLSLHSEEHTASATSRVESIARSG